LKGEPDNCLYSPFNTMANNEAASMPASGVKVDYEGVFFQTAVSREDYNGRVRLSCFHLSAEKHDN